MHEYSVAVTIGRNIDEHPMSGIRWNEYRNRVAELLQETAALYGVTTDNTGYEAHAGFGYWGAQREESERVSFYGLPERIATAIAGDLHTPLKDVALVFEQEAIAVTVGRVILVEGV